MPGFGDPKARLLVVGLAPAAHGANRTGRVFTGDRSGDFLFAALHRAGFANQPESTDAKDGLRLTGRLRHPHRPLRPAREQADPRTRSSPAATTWIGSGALFAPRLRAVLVLGRVAMDGLARDAPRERARLPPGRLAFGHGVTHDLAPGLRLFCSYHPSQQNTFTGRLTPRSFDAVLRKIDAHLNEHRPSRTRGARPARQRRSHLVKNSPSSSPPPDRASLGAPPRGLLRRAGGRRGPAGLVRVRRPRASR